MSLWDEVRPYQGTITDYPQKTQWGWTAEVRLRPEGKGGAVPVLLYTTQDCKDLKPGDRISLETELRSPGYNRPDRLHSFAARGIFAQTKTVKQFRVTPVEGIPLKYWPKAARRALRQRILQRHEKDEAALLLALLTGDQDELDEPFATELSRSGLRHIAAVSGLHVGVLTGLFLLLPGDRRLRQILAAVGLVAFCLVTGARPPVVRATVMGLCLLLGPFLRRDGDSVAALRTALLLLVLHNPYSLENVSLQLSFAAVLGVLRFAKPLNRRLMGGRERTKGEPIPLRLRRAVCASISLSLSALVFTTPLTALYFGTISLVSPLSNLLCLWAVELFFVGGALGTLLGFFLPAVGAAWLPFHACFAFVRWTVQFFACAPLGAVTTQVGWYRLWLAAVYAVLLLLWRRKGLRKRAALFLPALGAFLVLCVMLHRTLATSGLGTEVVDVGQGQSVLLLSRQSAAAVDCGGYNAGNALADAMYDAVEGTLDVAVLTHFDSDHMDGLEQLLRRVEVRELVVPDVEDDSGGRSQVEGLCRSYGVPVRAISEDETLTVGEMSLRLMAMTGDGADNDTGLAVLAEKGDYSVLITGDMDQEAELELLGRENLGPVNVLVAGHHGSRTSSGAEFLERIQPKTAVISCGEGNRYGHPHQETLERLEAAHCRVRRTDREGRVSLHAPVTE
jgi:competence protein ComEC